MKQLLIVFMWCMLALISESCTTSNENKQVNSDEYICPDATHKDIADQPGQCEVCGQVLIKKNNVEGATNSLASLEGKWENQLGESTTLSSFIGNYTLITMIFTKCEYACPNIIGDLKGIEDKLEQSVRDSLNVVLVTFDTENDTPEVLAEYASRPSFDLDQSRWKFLHGNKDEVYTLSKFLGIEYKKFENGMYGHNNIISLLNKKGEIVYQLKELHADSEGLVQHCENLHKVDKNSI